MTEIITTIGMVASIALPLWNIPLMATIIKRKSSKDLSLCWVLGVWSCIVLMAPSGFISVDPVWRVFTVTNLVLFTGVAVVAVKYRKGCP